MTRIKIFAPDAANTIQKGSKAYYEKAMQAVDAYTDDNRVIGNTLLAAARSYSDEIDGVLMALEERLEMEADQARDVAATMAQRTYKRALIAVALITIAGAIMTALVLRSISGTARPRRQSHGPTDSRTRKCRTAAGRPR